MEQKLKELMADLFKMKKEEISDSLTMKDTDVWDSLKHMELIVSIEETFNVQLSADEIVAMQDVKAIKVILTEKRLAA
jgi:acyl carrier protein